MKINKTNVARLLDKAKVAYQLVPYEVDENDLSATHVADQLGENVAQVKSMSRPTSTTPPDSSITFMSAPDNGVCRYGSLRRI